MFNITNLIENVIDIIIINKYEETLLTKYKYNFKLSEYEKFRLNLLFDKIKMLKLIGGRI